MVNIIYTNKRTTIGEDKLNSIIEEKENKGIYIIKNSKYRVEFSDGDIYLVEIPDDRARGQRFDKAFVDSKNTSISSLKLIIEPAMEKNGKIEYFNFY